MSVHEYGLKFTQLSSYAMEMVKDMRSRMSLFITGLSHASRKDGRVAIITGLSHFKVDGKCVEGRGRDSKDKRRIQKNRK